jgi:hypothetical protein
VVGNTMPRETAVQVFHDLYDALRPPAQQYFDLVTDPNAGDKR